MRGSNNHSIANNFSFTKLRLVLSTQSPVMSQRLTNISLSKLSPSALVCPLSISFTQRLESGLVRFECSESAWNSRMARFGGSNSKFGKNHRFPRQGGTQDRTLNRWGVPGARQGGGIPANVPKKAIRPPFFLGYYCFRDD